MITTRFAAPSDAFEVLRLYQKAAPDLLQDRSFLDLEALERGLDPERAPEQIWIVAEDASLPAPMSVWRARRLAISAGSPRDAPALAIASASRKK